MKVSFKITRQLMGEVQADLARRHAFAHERVGFIAAGLAAAGDDVMAFARGYRAVADEDYLRDPTVGAMMGPAAIRKALQWALKDGVAIFHVHTHGGRGVPGFSGIDVREHIKFMPNFFQVAPQCAHGALVLSDDRAFGHIWLEEEKTYRAIDKFTVVGAPLSTWRTG